MKSRAIKLAAATGAIAVASALFAHPATASGHPGSITSTVGRTPVAISMGDSFISGEGGRFAGNVYNTFGSDGAADNGVNNRGWGVYRDQYGKPVSGDRARCHRSLSAEINDAAAEFGQKPINLACSGATTDNILTNGQRGEDPQIKQLASIAADKNNEIKTIALSIGGNDLGFASILADCTQITSYIDCGTNGTYKKLADRRDTVKAKITNTLNEITRTLRANGYADGSYKFVYQSGPDIFATSGSRYRSSSIFTGYKESPGVPMSDATVDFAHNAIVPFINNLMKEAAAASINKSIQFLDLTDAFEGHQLSHTSTQQILRSSGKSPQAQNAEWVVPINSNYIAGSILDTERQQESYHPNMFGQMALSECLIGALKTTATQVQCHGAAGKGPWDQRITTG